MREYIGIDLGTTNSVISTYNGDHDHLAIHKSREGNNVTPSVISFDGPRMFIGYNAYVRAPHSPVSSAWEFKRRMGENTLIELPAADRTLTPEECSSEILKELRNYLPEELRNFEETGTVVTVPAAFNQKAKYATRQAAEMAGIGKVDLIQEPVAALMSFIHHAPKTEGIFLIYDLGGGTFDAAIAESSVQKKVSLLTHSGIEVCGGSDFDRLIVEHIVLPRLHEKYDLPNVLTEENGFDTLYNTLKFSAEQAKIELSRSEDARIDIPHPTMWTRGEVEEGLQDLKGNEIRPDQDIVLKRVDFDKLIADKVNDTVNSARKAMVESGVNSQDIEFIVWVGGPTHYKPLRDKIALELDIKGNMLSMTQMNPMTAVSEGASIFAESIDWSSKEGKIKRSREQISSNDLSFSFNYEARTSSDSAKIAVQVKKQVPSGYKFEVISGQSSWESGRIPLEHGAVVDVHLEKSGENTFKVIVYDDVGKPISTEQDKIVIAKTAATVEAIPCSHSIALEVLDKLNGTPTLVYLVRKNDPLPHTGTVKLKANEQLVAGTDNSLKFTLREGEFENIKTNENIGDFKIDGTDLPEGEVIPVDGDLICEYEIKTSDEIKVEVSVPDIGIVLEEIYSPCEGKENYAHIDKVNDVIENSIEANTRIDEIRKVVTDQRLDEAKQKLELASTLDPDESDPEKVKEAEQGIKQAEELIEVVSRMNRKQISQIALTEELTFFDLYCRQHARASEETEFDKLVGTAQRAIEDNDTNFNEHLNELKARIFEVLWRQPFFIIERFKNIRKTMPVNASDSQITALIHKGEQLLELPPIKEGYEKLPQEEKHTAPFIDDGTVQELREIVRQLMLIPRVAITQNAVNVFRAS